MNKVVLQHIPASELPERLRGAIPVSAYVTVTVQEETERKDLQTLFAMMQDAQSHGIGGGVSSEAAVARIRSLRDEWDE